MNKVKVVVVDDQNISRGFFEMYVRASRDYELVASLRTAQSSLDYVDKNKTDLVIMDVEMPVLDGVATVKGLRRMGYTDLPVIFLSSHRDIETVMRCKEAGAAEYIIKPTNKTYLQERVAAVLYNKLDI